MAPDNSKSVDMNGEDDDRPLELPIQKRPTRNKPNNLETTTTTTVQQQDNTSFRPRDPRFDPRCAGTNNVKHFVKNYSFVDEIRQNEISQLQQAFKKEKDPEKKQKIKNTILSMKNQLVEKQNKAKKLETLERIKKNLPAPSGGGGGKSRYRNIKKSDIKKELIVEKYKDLKETGKLSKYLERKRKKLINKDGRAFS